MNFDRKQHERRRVRLQDIAELHASKPPPGLATRQGRRQIIK